MEKPRPEFSLDDLLADLRPEDAVDGFTIRELCKDAGLPYTASNEAKVRRKVNDLCAKKLWEPCDRKKVTVTVTGSEWCGAAAFRPVRKGEMGKHDR